MSLDANTDLFLIHNFIFITFRKVKINLFLFNG